MDFYKTLDFRCSSSQVCLILILLLLVGIASESLCLAGWQNHFCQEKMETDFNKHENLHKNQCVRFSNLKDQKVEIETSALRTTDARRSFFFDCIPNCLGTQIGHLYTWGYFQSNYQHYFVTVSPLSIEKWIWLFFLFKKFRFSTYIHQGIQVIVRLQGIKISRRLQFLEYLRTL